jgi:enoyl-CoA hydratase
MSYEEIRLVKGVEIGELVLHRPESRNAMTDAMGAEIARAVDELNADAKVRAVLVRGEGEAFSAGGDWAMLSDRSRRPEAENRIAMMGFYANFLAVRRLHAPTIAVIGGAAIGAGLCFAMACDLRVAAVGAKLAASFVRLGLHPGMGASFLLPRLIGTAAATELLLTGRSVDADEALRLGLVNQVHRRDALDVAARALAAQIATAAPIAVAQTKATLVAAFDRELEATLEREAAAQAIDFGTADLTEALAAAAERRPPKFSGS